MGRRGGSQNRTKNVVKRFENGDRMCKKKNMRKINMHLYYGSGKLSPKNIA
jgi:hypothetical protein